MSKVGIIETINSSTVKLIGYGTVHSKSTKIIDDLGVECESIVVVLESGELFEVTDQLFAEEYKIKEQLEIFKNMGITIL